MPKTLNLLSSSLLAVALAACGGSSGTAADPPEAIDESEVVSGLQGSFQTDAPANAKMRPGYLYRLDISKPSNGKRYATVYVVSDLCGKQSADGSCERSWIDESAESLDKYWNDLGVSTAKKTLAMTYETEDAHGETTEVSRKWAYKLVPNGIELTEAKAGARAFDVKRLPAHKVDAAIKAAFSSWMEHVLDNDTSEIDRGPTVATASLPLAARRSIYMYKRQWSYDTDVRKIKVGGKDYYSLSQQNDGGGAYVFFTLAGDELGQFGGSESGEWDFDWNEY